MGDHYVIECHVTEKALVGEPLQIHVAWDLPEETDRRFWIRAKESGSWWGIQHETLLQSPYPNPFGVEAPSGRTACQIIPRCAGKYSVKATVLDSRGRVEYESEPVNFQAVIGEPDQERASRTEAVRPGDQ